MKTGASPVVWSMVSDAHVVHEQPGLRALTVARELGAAAGSFAVFAGTAVFVTYFSFALPYGFTRVVSGGAFRTDFLPLELAAVLLLAALTAAGVWFSFAGDRIHHFLEDGRVAALVWPLAVVGLAVGTFAAATGLLYDADVLELRGERLTEETIVGAAGDFYLWHMFNAFPLLDITETLRWEARYEYDDSTSGALLLAFKGFVLLPLISAGRVILSGRPHRKAVYAAARRAVPGSRIVRPRSWSGHHWVVVEIGTDRILVETRREVHGAGATLAQWQASTGSVEAGELTGYLLVVEAISAGARGELEAVLAGSSLPAAVAVWHKDDPAAALADRVSELRAEIARRQAGRDQPA